MVVTALGVAAATLSVGAPTAGANPLRDADPAAAAQIALQIVNADTAIRINAFVLPGAEADLVRADTVAAAAIADEARVHAVGPTASGVGSGDVASAASTALLNDLAPEQASSTRLAAQSAAATALARRDAVKAGLAAAIQQKADLIAALAQYGQWRTLWSVMLLDRLGAPVTSENLRGLAAWIDAESNAASLRNPLATTQDAPGARNANEVGVKGYPTDEIGLDATVQTLHNGRYPNILDALARGDSAIRLTNSVAASPWGTGVNATIRLRQSGG
jgi:hypothetical protein